MGIVARIVDRGLAEGPLGRVCYIYIKSNYVCEGEKKSLANGLWDLCGHSPRGAIGNFTIWFCYGNFGG